MDPDGFMYYKVVVSKNNSSPAYPDDGYAAVISDYRTTSYTVKNGADYTGGDFGGSIKPGETYYFSITAVYENGKVKGNAVRMTMPGKSEPKGERKATVSAQQVENGIKLTWNRVDPDGFVYYKVVVSKNNPNPVYPKDGYLVYITDYRTTSCTVRNYDGYNGGDFGGVIKPGETYYFSITAVYDHENVRGNAVRKTMPGSVEPEPKPGTEQELSLTYWVEDGLLHLDWNSLKGSGFKYYKVVISKNNPNPSYPDDGYLYVITDINQSSAVINRDHKYDSGDFGGYLVPGESYYFGITAVFDNMKICSNVLRITCP